MLDHVESIARDVVAEIHDTNPGRQILESVGVHRTVHCDRERTQQLLSNLLGNARHHGTADQPVVDAAARGDKLLLSVSNRVEPIAPENITKVFQPYWRSRWSPHGAGLGVGLHICSQIVNEHGGSLKVTLLADAGTRFHRRNSDCDTAVITLPGYVASSNEERSAYEQAGRRRMLEETRIKNARR